MSDLFVYLLVTEMFIFFQWEFRVSRAFQFEIASNLSKYKGNTDVFTVFEL